MKSYTCPVCGYDQLTEEPAHWSICPCCFTEFGASDISWTHEELREDWILGGARWHDPDLSPPIGWNPIAQLKNIGYEVTEEDRKHIVSGDEFSRQVIIIRSKRLALDISEWREGEMVLLSPIVANQVPQIMDIPRGTASDPRGTPSNPSLSNCNRGAILTGVS